MARHSPTPSWTLLAIAALVLPYFFTGLAAAADTGVELITDPAGDDINNAGPGSDILRVGASTDASNLHFFLTVNTPGAPSSPPRLVDWAVFFTVPGTPALSYFANARMPAGGSPTAMTNIFVYRDTNGECGGGTAGQAITASWTGNVLEFVVPRSLVGSPANGVVLGNVFAASAGCTAPSNTLFDRAPNSGATTYTVGTNGVTTPTVPAAPAGLLATAGSAQVSLAWNAPANGGAAITSYEIHRATTSGAETLLVSTGTSATTFVDSGLTNGVTYYYKVAAVNSVGTGPLSAEASATPAASPPPAPLSFTNYPGPAAFALSTGPNPENIGFHTADGGGEPSIGVNWKTGNVMVTGGWAGDTQSIYRVTFDDSVSPPAATWSPVSPRAGFVGTVDAILFTDSDNGRTWAGGILHGCSHIAISDNDGQTWIQTAESCALPSFDHETIGAFPWAEPLDPLNGNPAFPSVVYYCAQADALAQCASSFDGGITYNPGVALPCTYLHGSIRGGPDGAVYLPFKDCGAQWLTGSPLPGYPGGQAVVRSLDNGVTWEHSALPVSYAAGNAWTDPAVAVGRGDEVDGGRVYAIAMAADHHPYVMTSDDRAQTWQNKVDLTTVGDAIGVKAVTFLQVTVGDDDRAAVSFEGTKGVSTATGYYGGSNCGSGEMIWHHYMGMTYDGGLTWTVIDVTPNDPVQRGPIWGSGGDPAGGCRNLLDFESMTMDAEGRPLAVWADGCISATCVGPSGTAASSRNSLVTITRLTSGRGLLAEFDDQPPALSATAGGPYSGVAGSAIGIAGAASGGTSPYTFAWSVIASPLGSTGGSFANANAATTSFTPDIAGVYGLRLTVTDSALGSVTADAVVTASTLITSGCQLGGVTLAEDASDDGGAVGTASEAFCLRASNTASTIDLYIDLKGRGVTSDITSDTPVLYDIYFSASNAGGDQRDQAQEGAPFPLQMYLWETTWDGSVLDTGLYSWDTGAVIATETVTSEWVGNTIHLIWDRAGPLAPKDGDRMTSIQLDLQHCVVSCLDEIVDDDMVPDEGFATAFTVGGTPTTGGDPLPLCGDELGTDVAGDSLQGSPGTGLRDLRAIAASDTDSSATFCWTVQNFSDRPSGPNSDEAAKTAFNAFFSAPYEGSGIAYSVAAVINPDGTIDAANSGWLKGVCDPGPFPSCLTGVDGGPVVVSVSGDVIRLQVDRASIGSPEDGDSITGISVDVRPFSDQSTSQDQKDSITPVENFRFGQRVAADTTPPSQVTGLTVTDPETGDKLNLAWNAASDNVAVVKYNVFRGATLVATPTGTSYQDTGLTVDTSYTYTVSAEDAKGNVGPASAPVSGTPTDPIEVDTTPPSVPTNLVACGTSTSSICVSWTSSSDAESGVKHYRVFRDGGFVATTTLSQYTDSPLVAETAYSYTVSAVNNVDLESAQSAAASISTLGFTGPEIAITSPVDGATSEAPVTIAGTYSTTGQPQEPTGAHSFEDGLPWQVAEWITDPFVTLALRSAEFADASDDLADLDGFLSAYPTTSGTIQVLLSGKTPLAAPTETRDSHWPIKYAEDVKVDLLKTQAVHKAQTVFTLDDVRNGLLQASPEGPPVPGIQDGIGPGTAIQMTNPIDGLTYICTAAYLFENAATGKYYLQTAGHCLLDTSVSPTDSVTMPGRVVTSVSFCYSNCVNNALGIGTYIEIPGSYVTWAYQGGVGQDAGFIEIPQELNQFLRPWMYFWNGPAGSVDKPVLGDALVHYGHGLGSGALPIEQSRAAVAINVINNNANSFNAAGFIWGGDSGSAIGVATPDVGHLVQGGSAAGIITHATAVNTPVGFPGNSFYGTGFKRALDMAQGPMGFRPTLVTQDAVIREGIVVPPVTLNTAITAPAAGTTIPVGDSLSVSGTATFPVAVSPGTDIKKYYLARDQCGAPAGQPDIDDNPHLVSIVTAAQASCGSLAHPIGPVWEATLGPLADIFPAEPAPTDVILLDPTRPISGTIWFGCYKGASGNPACVPSGVNDIEIFLTSGTTLIGSVRLLPQLVFGADPQPVAFSFPAQNFVIPVGKTPTLTVQVHQAAGPLFLTYGGSTFASFVDIPLGTVATNAVELYVDVVDAAHQVATSGSSSWNAEIPPALLTAGAHTIIARATQGATVDTTPASVGITVLGVTLTPPTASFTTSVSGLTVGVTDTSTAGDGAITTRTWDWGDGSPTDTGATATHTYAESGTYTVTLIVTDENDLSDSASSDLTVDAPITWAIDLLVSGSQGDVLPRASAGNVEAGDGSWSYFFDQQVPPGLYTIEARLLKDGEPVATTTSTFNVPDLNLAPIIDPVLPQAVAQGDTLSFTVTGNDPDNGPSPLVWSLVSAPSGVTFDPNTQQVTWPTTFSNLGAYTISIRATDGRASAQVDVPVTVTLTPRAPTIQPIPAQSVVEEATLTTWVRATTLNHDTVELAAIGLPTGATFTDHGNNTGKLVWTTAIGDKGTRTITVTATSYGLTTTSDITVNVLMKTSLTLVHTGASSIQTSPGKVLTVTARVTNTGPQADVFRFTTTVPAGWSLSAPADAALAPGESMDITLTLTVSNTATGAQPKLTATSLGNGAVARAIAWSVTMPIEATVEMTSTSPLSSITGIVRVAYTDGTPIENAVVKVTQTPTLLGASFSSFVSGRTLATGEYVFDFGADNNARIAGPHDLLVTVVASSTARVTSSYTVAPEVPDAPEP